MPETVLFRSSAFILYTYNLFYAFMLTRDKKKKGGGQMVYFRFIVKCKTPQFKWAQIGHHHHYLNYLLLWGHSKGKFLDAVCRTAATVHSSRERSLFRRQQRPGLFLINSTETQPTQVRKEIHLAWACWASHPEAGVWALARSGHSDKCFLKIQKPRWFFQTLNKRGSRWDGY